MLEIIFIHYKPLLKILLYSFIILSVGSIIFWKKIKEYVINNWNELRREPWMLPFVGIFKKEKGQSFLDVMMTNLVAVIRAIVKPILKILMLPLYAISKLIIILIRQTTNILQFFRKQLTIIRNFMLKLFEQMYIRIQNSVGAIMFFILKLRESMKRSFGVFSLVLNTMEHSQMFFESLVKGPVGKFASIVDWMGIASARFALGPWGPATWRNALHVPTNELMCFNPNVKIKLNNNNYKILDNLQIGDILSDNSVVIAKIDVNYKGSIFKIDNIEVTGEHYINYSNKWIKVKDHPNKEEVSFNNDHLICLVTSSGLIKIGDHIFKDYIDNHDPKLNQIIIDKVNRHLNNNVSQVSNCSDLLSGFVVSQHFNTPNDIEGIIEIAPGTLDLYDINGSVLSGNVLIKYENSWLRVALYPTAKYIGKNIEKCYHYITKSQIIKLNNSLIIRDFTESKDPILNSEISTIIEKTIN